MYLAHSLDNFVEAVSSNASLFSKARFSETKSNAIDSRFEVYRNSYSATLNRALTQIYPVTQLIVGEACFNRMSQDFIELTPSYSVDLNNYGNDFAEFIQQQVSGLQAFSGLPYLCDLARLEYAWHKIYFAADEPPFPFDLFTKSVEQADLLVLTLNPTLQILTTNYPVTDIWKSHRQGVKSESIQQLECQYYVCIIRKNDYISVFDITLELFQLLHNSQQGKTLDFIAEENPACLQQLTYAIEQKYITGFSIMAVPE